MNEHKYFIDTNILVYAFDKSDVKKQQIAKSILEKAWKGKTSYHISNQILAEFSRAITQKIENPIPINMAIEIISIFRVKEWIISNYTEGTITSALKLLEKHKFSFLGCSCRCDNVRKQYF